MTTLRSFLISLFATLRDPLRTPALRRVLLVDLLFTAALIGIPALPLVVLRYTPYIYSDTVMVGLLTAWILLWIAWPLVVRWVRGGHPVPELRLPGPRTSAPRPSVGWVLVVCLAILLVNEIGYARPFAQNYYAGLDEAAGMVDTSIWLPFYDTIANRPFGGSMAYIGVSLTPGSLEGWLWLTILHRFVNGVLLYAIVGLLLPKARWIALLGALLYLVNPAEPSRFFFYMAPYFGATVTLMMGLWLLMHSYLRESRRLLVAACVMLAFSLLQYEAGFPPALLGFVFLALLRRKPGLLVWGTAWAGTIALLAARFIQFSIQSADTGFYQTGYLNAARDANLLETVAQNLIRHSRVTFALLTNYLAEPDALIRYGGYGVAAVLIAGAAGVWIVRQRAAAPSQGDLPRRLYALGILLALFAALLCFSSWLPFPPRPLRNWQENPTLRFHHFSSIAHGAFWALLIAWLASWLPSGVRQRAVIAGCAVLIAFGTVTNHAEQSGDNIINPGTTIETVSVVYQFVHQTHPDLPDNAVIFFLLEEDQPSPLGWSFHVRDLSCAFFGVPAYHGTFSPERGWLARSITNYPPPDAPDYAALNFEGREMFVFEVAHTGQIREVTTPFPAVTPPADAQAAGACFRRQLDVRPGEPLPYLLNLLPEDLATGE